MICTLLASVSAHAAQCGGDFNTFIASMSREAQAAGISQGVISQALGGVTLDQAVLNFDRRQRGTFNKSFEQYVATRVGAGRIKTGQAMLQRHAALLSRIERQFGVPPQIIVAIWGLETDFGKGDMGKLPVFRVLATMAHDCRRTELFQNELLSALKIVQRGVTLQHRLPGLDASGADPGRDILLEALVEGAALPSVEIEHGLVQRDAAERLRNHPLRNTGSLCLTRHAGDERVEIAAALRGVRGDGGEQRADHHDGDTELEHGESSFAGARSCPSTGGIVKGAHCVPLRDAKNRRAMPGDLTMS
jgi:hypothetical protein